MMLGIGTVGPYVQVVQNPDGSVSFNPSEGIPGQETATQLPQASGPLFDCPSGERVYRSADCHDPATWAGDAPASPDLCKLYPMMAGCPGVVTVEQAAANAAAEQKKADAAKPKPSGQWFTGVSNTTVLIAGGVVAGALFLKGRR